MLLSELMTSMSDKLTDRETSEHQNSINLVTRTIDDTDDDNKQDETWILEKWKKMLLTDKTL